MSWKDAKGKWHGTPAYLGGSAGQTLPTPPRRKKKPKTSRSKELAALVRSQKQDNKASR